MPTPVGRASGEYRKTFMDGFEYEYVSMMPSVNWWWKPQRGQTDPALGVQFIVSTAL